MRFYNDFREVYSEVMRDLAEMGKVVRPKTMQNKNIDGDKDYETKELQNYSYTILHPERVLNDPHEKVDVEWCEAEFLERISPLPINPGEAYKLRPEVWNEFLVPNPGWDHLPDRVFDYTYSERMYDQLPKLIEYLKADPDTRRAYLSIWNPYDLMIVDTLVRVPCSLGYLFQIRDGKLTVKYSMRSCDIMTHFANDVYLAAKLQAYVAEQVGVGIGHLVHEIGSLHAYNKDLKGVF